MIEAAVPLLEVAKLTASYGGIEAIHGISLTIHAGEVVAVLGPNGAGKSTLLKSLMGLVQAQGLVQFAGSPIGNSKARQRAQMGIVLVPEGRGVLAPLTVRENLELGAYLRWGKESRARIEQDMGEVFALFPVLATRLKARAGHLSGGQQQMLAIGRAVMARPRLLLLDEPSLGLAPMVAAEIFTVLGQLNASGLTVLLVEQKAPLAAALATRAYVMRSGNIIAQVSKAELGEGVDLSQYYLGVVS